MNVSQSDFEFMKDCLIRDIIAILVEEKGMSLPAAFDLFYNSDTYSKLSDPETGLFFQSPRYVLSYLLSSQESNEGFVAESFPDNYHQA